MELHIKGGWNYVLSILADVVEATALVVCIAPVGVQVLVVVAATKMDIAIAPSTDYPLVIQDRM